MNKNSIPTLLGAAVFFTAPFALAYALHKGVPFLPCFILYVQIVLAAYIPISVVSTIVMWIQKRKLIPLRKPSRLPEWAAMLGAGMALIIAIVAGIIDGFTTGIIVFWPGAFFSICAINLVHWLVCQIRSIQQTSA